MTSEEVVILLGFLGVVYLIWKSSTDGRANNSPLTGGMFVANPYNSAPLAAPDPYSLTTNGVMT